ncbi:MAG: tRNA (adenosine(37)-N6)-threonylcarbamoyltransferase complex transferase subunit TsaD [Pseudomonadota bacterium]
MLVLGIETSCDETAAALVVDGREIRSSVVSSQIAVHQPYGGVVPELASRKHLENIVSVVQSAFDEARLTAGDLDAVAVTQGPGLVGALLVGFSFAKAFAFARNLPFVGVNHLDGHINSLFLTDPPPRFPFVTLLVSGGHTSLYHVTGHTAATLLGQTRDDAAGEAFDKVAKMLDLGYPGGPVISQMAEAGNPAAIAFPRPFMDKSEYDFSFSGLKTAVSRYIHDVKGSVTDTLVRDIAASFQAAAVDVLVGKLFRAADALGCRSVAMVGGVAANPVLRKSAGEAAGRRGVDLFVPPVALCGDNAAMIAAAGYHLFNAGRTADLTADVFSTSRLGTAAP